MKRFAPRERSRSSGLALEVRLEPYQARRSPARQYHDDILHSHTDASTVLSHAVEPRISVADQPDYDPALPRNGVPQGLQRRTVPRGERRDDVADTNLVIADDRVTAALQPVPSLDLIGVGVVTRRACPRADRDAVSNRRFAKGLTPAHLDSVPEAVALDAPLQIDVREDLPQLSSVLAHLEPLLSHDGVFSVANTDERVLEFVEVGLGEKGL